MENKSNEESNGLKKAVDRSPHDSNESNLNKAEVDHSQNNNLKRNSDKKYDNISNATRMAFIKRVLSKQSTIKEAAEECGIKFSTSKAILQTFRREGRVGKKKFRQKKLKETFSNEVEQVQIGDEKQVQSLQNLEILPSNQAKIIKECLVQTNFLKSAPELDYMVGNQNSLYNSVQSNQNILLSQLQLSNLAGMSMNLLPLLIKKQLISQEIAIQQYQQELAKERQENQLLLMSIHSLRNQNKSKLENNLINQQHLNNNDVIYFYYINNQSTSK